MFAAALPLERMNQHLAKKTGPRPTAAQSWPEAEGEREDTAPVPVPSRPASTSPSWPIRATTTAARTEQTPERSISVDQLAPDRLINHPKLPFAAHVLKQHGTPSRAEKEKTGLGPEERKREKEGRLSSREAGKTSQKREREGPGKREERERRLPFLTPFDIGTLFPNKTR